MDSPPVVNTFPVVVASAASTRPSDIAARSGADEASVTQAEGGVPPAIAFAHLLDMELKSLLAPDTDPATVITAGMAEDLAGPGPQAPAPVEIRADPFAAMLLAPILSPAAARSDPVADDPTSAIGAGALPGTTRTPGGTDVPEVERGTRERNFNAEPRLAGETARAQVLQPSEPAREALPALAAAIGREAMPETAAEPPAPGMPVLHAPRVTVEPRTEPVAALPQVRIEPEVGTSGFREVLGQKMVFLVGREMQTAELRLNPPNLGPLEVRLTVSADGADAFFFSAQSEVRQAVELALPRLREILAENGIALGQASVSDRQPQPEPQAGPGASRGAHRVAAPEETGTVADAASSPRAVAYAVAEGRLVDTFA